MTWLILTSLLKSYKTKDLPKHATCEVSSVIYLTTYTKCQKHYVGETYRAQRMYEHKASVQKYGQITPILRHFKNDGQGHKHMQFSGRVVYIGINQFV